MSGRIFNSEGNVRIFFQKADISDIRYGPLFVPFAGGVPMFAGTLAPGAPGAPGAPAAPAAPFAPDAPAGPGVPAEPGTTTVVGLVAVGVTAGFCCVGDVTLTFTGCAGCLLLLYITTPPATRMITTITPITIAVVFVPPDDSSVAIFNLLLEFHPIP